MSELLYRILVKKSSNEKKIIIKSHATYYKNKKIRNRQIFKERY